ncbi:two-component system CheB/CheR fusion protein [Oxalobacteraceae bacterium GrIS 2.11]
MSRQSLRNYSVVEQLIITKSSKKSPATKPGNSDGEKKFPVVGIGASAGGLAAFEAFFSGMPTDADPGMAFVLVQHLAPDYKSMLSEIIQRFTRMHVCEVQDGMKVEPNCAYIIPPNRELVLLNGSLRLTEPSAPRGHRLVIDSFFISLAEDQHERAIGIILAGTGADGTAGIRAIKAEGGMVIAQTLESTEFDGMPRSAIATGLVDFTLAPADMPAQLINYAAHAFGKLPKSVQTITSMSDTALKKIFTLLRSQTSHDFSHYKPSTINRRIERRMAVHQIATLTEYVKYLQHAPEEVSALFRDLLIGVTNFFRDPKAFSALEEKIIPKLISKKPDGVPIRVWSPGCSSGEEPYSLAILMYEALANLKKNNAVQIFATDIDSQAIATARAGIYPASMAQAISQERLAHFFNAEPDGTTYRIRKEIRDMLVFSEQNVIKDPPFSKLDLISCRNLMIYLDAELQKILIPLFHFALKPGGILFLGTSEGIGGFEDLFEVLDRDNKIYQRKEDYRCLQRTVLGRFLEPVPRLDLTHITESSKPVTPVKLELRKLTEQMLLQQVAPPSAMVNEQGDILYLHGRTGMFLELTPGIAGINNILKMAREGLRPALTAALTKCAETRQITHSNGLSVKTNGHFTSVNLSIFPVSSNHVAAPASLYLVTLEEGPLLNQLVQLSTGKADGEPNAGNDAQIAALKQELRIKDEYIQTAQEELESSTEELKSSNEEMQSVNEELQSTNEELETSKEELQSVNEELATVNAELQTKVIDLSRANNDMNNLLAGTGIGTIFVDHELRILRFTPAASMIINLIASDIGRPVGHIVSNLLAYDKFVSDIKAVLNTLIPKELEVQLIEHKWYAMRIQPYRTLDNVIEGAVISFVDVTEKVKIRESLRLAEDSSRLSNVVRDSTDAVIAHDLDGRILSWNPAATMLYGWTEAEALKLNIADLIPNNADKKEIGDALSLTEITVLEARQAKRLNKNGNIITVQQCATTLVDGTKKVYAIATMERAYG